LRYLQLKLQYKKSSDSKSSLFDLSMSLRLATTILKIVRGKSDHWWQTQCCQLADIWAAAHKTQKWPHKNLSGRKNPRPIVLQICLKMSEKWQNFLEGCSSHKNLDNLHTKSVK
jgi:hypothetical protein